MFSTSCSPRHPTFLGRQVYRSTQSTRWKSPRLARNVSLTAKTKELTTPDEEDDLLSSLTKRRGGRTNRGGTKMSPREWLNSEEGRRFRDPVIGRTNWLGDDVPFPSNPWFKPQPPLWDGVRQKVYESFKNRVNSIPPNQPQMSIADSKTQEQVLIRKTSEQWGISKERVAAIIRLKALEDSWTIPSQSLRKPAEGSNRTLQLNFEKGMENVLGVERTLSKRVEENVHELENRKLLRKSKFYGFEFVPLDSPLPVNVAAPEAAEVSSDSRVAHRRYREDDVPSKERHVTSADGIPRPPPCYISAPRNKIPMVFTDVSEFPRQAKPVSKRKAKHFPRTSLLANFLESNPPRHSRGNCTLASMSVRIADEDVPYPTGTLKSAENKSLSNEQKEVVSELLRRFKGCSNSDAGIKMLDDFKFDSSSKNSGLDSNLLKEMVLIRAGGLSFRKSMGTWDSELSMSADTALQSRSSTPEDEEQIRSMKYQMMKSIYMRKLELQQAGSLLLPKIVRDQQEQDRSMLHPQASGVQTENKSKSIAPSSTKLRRGDRLVKQHMKGPASRMKQRQLLTAKVAET